MGKGSLLTKTGIVSLETGSTTWPKDTVNISILMDRILKVLNKYIPQVNGQMIYHMVKGSRCSLMAPCMMETTWGEKNRGKVSWNSKTDLFIEEGFIRMKWMVMGNMSGQMVGFTLASGKCLKCMEAGSSFSQMVHITPIFRTKVWGFILER